MQTKLNTFVHKQFWGASVYQLAPDLARINEPLLISQGKPYFLIVGLSLVHQFPNNDTETY